MMMWKHVAVTGLLLVVLGSPAQGQSKADAQKELEQAYQSGKYDNVIEQANRMLRSDSKDDVAYYFRGSAKIDFGLASRNTKMVREGIADARQAITIKGSDNLDYYLPYLYGMASLSEVERNPEHAKVAIGVATKVLQLSGLADEQKANVYYQRGRANGIIGEFKNAVRDHEAAIRINPKHLAARLQAAHGYLALKDTKKAETAFAAAVREFPNDPVPYNDRGMYFQRTKQYDKALADFSRVLEMNPDAAYAYTNRGFTLLEQGNPQAAEIDFSKALSIQPQAMIYSFRGTARLAQGKVREATTDYQQVVRLSPKSAVAQADLGFAHYFAKNYAEAARSFDAATKTNKDLKHLYPWWFLAMSKTNQGRQAAERFQEMLKEDARNWSWPENIVAYLAGKQTDQELIAAVHSEDAEIKKAQTCEAHYFIAERAALSGNRQLAGRHYRQALDTKAKHLSAYRGAEFALK